MTKETRLDKRFATLKANQQKAFVAFITAGDPNLELSQDILNGLPSAGADIIELGMPFTDPMADGPAVQHSSQRALAAGQTMIKTLNMVKTFRQKDNDTPIVLMGYYNPIYHYGVNQFITDCLESGVDGLIVVDLPPEEDEEFCVPALDAGLNFIRLATPTTDDARLPAVLKNTSGFVYYVSINGITGSASPDQNTVEQAIARIKRYTDLPIAIGFGIKTPEQAHAMAQAADGVVVGSVLVDQIAQTLGHDGAASKACVDAVLGLASDLAKGVHS